MLELTVAVLLLSVVAGLKCPDQQHCGDEQTCCQSLFSGEYKCCPFQQGVCCADHFHCCPNDTSCNMKTLTCDSSGSSVPMSTLSKSFSEKEKAVKLEQSEVNRSVQCDHATSCPDHTTCCLMQKTHKWGCCPLADALCCNGGEHCCPKGYTCSGDSCVQSAWPQVEILPLTSTRDSAPLQIQNDIDCGGGFTCSDTQTCCKMSETTWGCCPFPKAVCCSDMLHCCPSGYICDEAGACSQETGFGWNNWENFLRKKKRAVHL